MKTLTPILLALVLLVSCTSRAIEPISNYPVKYPMPPLWVCSIYPAWGVYKPGDKILIQGHGFKKGAQAFVGGKPCLSTRVKSDTRVSCKLPENEPGDHSVTLVNPDGKVSPIALTAEEIAELAEEDQGSDGLIYFYYVKPRRNS